MITSKGDNIAGAPPFVNVRVFVTSATNDMNAGTRINDEADACHDKLPFIEIMVDIVFLRKRAIGE